MPRLVLRLNIVQKSAIAVSVCLIILTVFLQNPISGYAIKLDQQFNDPRACNEAEKQETRELYIWAEKNLKPSGYTNEQIEQKVRECTSYEYPAVYLPLSEWRSNSPHVFWLGPVINLLFTICTIAAMALSVIVLFRTPPVAK